jgi:uncharacterized protein (UPF0333 family)
MNTQLVLAGVIIGITLVTIGTTTPTLQQSAEGVGVDLDQGRVKAPAAISGDNIYITWWTNKTGNDEVMFRVSIDAGGTFGDKINLSNTTSTDSVDAEIAADGGNVVVTWWERNQTSNEPAARVSTDNGLSFGPILKLAANGTIGEAQKT